MEKKNKKVLITTIVAVTLLIALIIGATYAYFQANNTASGTTNLDATTEAIGNVVVTNPTENLYLKLSAYEMHEDQKNNSYYATSTNGTGVVYASERENNVFANYSIEGGTDNTTYNCTFKLNITKPQDIRSGDMNLEISLLNGAKINGGSTLTTDLYNASTSYNVEFSAKGNGNGNLITGDIRLNNTTGVQDHLIGKTLSTTINVSDLECEVAEPSASSQELVAGLYDENDVMTMSWQELLDGNYLFVENGVLTSNNYSNGHYDGTAITLQGKLVIDKSVTSLATNALLTTQFSYVEIPDTVTDIGEGAFMSSGIEEIKIPNNIKVIKPYTFDGCGSLTKVELSNNIEKIEDHAFSLTSLVEIDYNGTKAEWNNIELYRNDNNEPYWCLACSDITVHCIDGDIIIPEYEYE